MKSGPGSGPSPIRSNTQQPDRQQNYPVTISDIKQSQNERIREQHSPPSSLPSRVDTQENQSMQTTGQIMNSDDPNNDLYAQKRQIEQQIAMLKGQLVQNSEKLMNNQPPSLNNINGNNYFE